MPFEMSNCTCCASAFQPHPQERAFLEKIGLPLPTHCPLCRRQARFGWRNERKLYHRKCDLTGKQIISVYAPDSPYRVYDQHEWHTDRWDGLKYGREMDFSRPFFEQFDELMRETPKISLFASKNINSDYTNGTQQDRDCYMIFVSDHNENCFYSYCIFKCESCIECVNCSSCTLCIECIDCSDCYNLAYSEQSHTCRDSCFLSDCKGCSDCFGCFGLRNKRFCLFNEQLAEEVYREKLHELNTGNIHQLSAARDIALRKASERQVHQYIDGNGNEDVTGDHIVNCKRSIECYDSVGLLDCGYLVFSLNSRDCYDGHVVVDNSELCYETISTINQYNTQFTFVSFYSKNAQYLDHCLQCEDCFGCSGLRRNRFCILNKQYTEQEYRRLREKIIKHMKKTGEWGQPMPLSLSPFGYNETVAQEYHPLTAEEATKRGWKWKVDVDEQTSAYQGPAVSVPEDISEVPDTITRQILTCERTGRPYKIIPQELELYRKHRLPLPRVCFDTRHVDRLQRRNPRQLWKRNCSTCRKSLETSYAPERPEIICCEKCYLKEVY